MINLFNRVNKSSPIERSGVFFNVKNKVPQFGLLSFLFETNGRRVAISVDAKRENGDVAEVIIWVNESVYKAFTHLCDDIMLLANSNIGDPFDVRKANTKDIYGNECVITAMFTPSESVDDLMFSIEFSFANGKTYKSVSNFSTEKMVLLSQSRDFHYLLIDLQCGGYGPIMD